MGYRLEGDWGDATQQGCNGRAFWALALGGLRSQGATASALHAVLTATLNGRGMEMIDKEWERLMQAAASWARSTGYWG